jgi:hypothetical protein
LPGLKGRNRCSSKEGLRKGLRKDYRHQDGHVTNGKINKKWN